MLATTIGFNASEIQAIQQQIGPYQTSSYQQVVANKVNRASNKLLKWDAMANKIQEVNDKNELLAQERDVALKIKLDKAMKLKSESIKFQQKETMLRAK